MGTSRANVVSSFTIIKGAMISETYAVFADWDFSRPKRENLDRLRDTNFIGATSQTWLRDVAKVLNRRFDPEGADRPLVWLAQQGCDIEVWKPLLLWHITRNEFLVRDFFVSWLFPEHESGAYRLRAEDLHPFLKRVAKRGGKTEHAWTDATIRRVAAGLLKMGVDFGLLRGSVRKEFASYHLPEQSFLYLLHAMREHNPNPRRTTDAADWRMFLMDAGDVERELLRLHQFRKLEYQVAGSIVELGLPCANTSEYAQRMVA